MYWERAFSSARSLLTSGCISMKGSIVRLAAQPLSSMQNMGRIGAPDILARLTIPVMNTRICPRNSMGMNFCPDKPSAELTRMAFSFSRPGRMLRAEPWESRTQISVAPAARAPSTAAFASSVMIRRKRP